MWCTAQVWDTRKFKVPLHVWEGLPAKFETTKVLILLHPFLFCFAATCQGLQLGMQQFQGIASGYDQSSSSRVPNAMQKWPRLGRHGSMLCGYVFVKSARRNPANLLPAVPVQSPLT